MYHHSYLFTGDISSLSGSESDSSSSESDEFPSVRKDRKVLSAVPTYLQSVSEKPTGSTDSDSDTGGHIEELVNRHPKVFFRNSNEELLAIYRCVLHSKKVRMP